MSNNLEVQLAEIRTDVKWIKVEIQKGHACKNEAKIESINIKAKNNRYMLYLLFVMIIPFLLKLFIKVPQ